MKANELRIGNLILHHNHKIKESFDECVVWMVSEDHLRVRVNDLHNEVVSADYCSGIPLTEEWLLKFGFIDTGSGIYDLNDMLILYFKRDDEFSLMGYNYRKGQTPTVFQYVHQFQNLYFALTGEELHL